MSEAWTWTYAGADGSQLSGPALPTTAFPTQTDAEAWLSESWEDLGDEGVDSVTLSCDGAVVYGPMSLQPGS
jgi:hypothetical protein